jgi:hypothetical protein
VGPDGAGALGEQQSWAFEDREGRVVVMAGKEEVKFGQFFFLLTFLKKCLTFS